MPLVIKIILLLFHKEKQQDIFFKYLRNINAWNILYSIR